MRIIFSRKGFDSSSGGCPSPVLPDGRLVTLPIPDTGSKICYRDLHIEGINTGRLVSQLSGAKIKSSSTAHLDPDLIKGHLPRLAGWCPSLGQTGSAQGHLRNQQVQPGDLFLFFGLFREAEIYRRRWRFISGTTARHLLWGWLQIDEIVPVDRLTPGERPWLQDHPHLHGVPDSHNTLYLARRSLSLPGLQHIPGSGVFERFASKLQLTLPGSPKPSIWQLPTWFYPADRPPLSYHHNPERWHLKPQHCVLKAVARGQEFVLQASHYPESGDWLRQLFAAD
ncbi:hypothetical protein [Amphritea pacifica]|uniref:Nucleotide modification associated domain-containing protein n=1 Tax=Amphritea pacifica TaxID=2811233 RepID=A0ABS2W6D1_9GAMM|nr:hypothetical protein [Amphritea pacifica]MBN0987274.1 hypothetical protein [Amphritea pacifica]MBN1005764.1 hypothetical protein [Amphritea pacifica]